MRRIILISLIVGIVISLIPFTYFLGLFPYHNTALFIAGALAGFVGLGIIIIDIYKLSKK
jgi:hypothetical protein